MKKILIIALMLVGFGIQAQEHDYAYYKRTEKKALLQRNLGITLTVLGLTGQITGLALSRSADLPGLAQGLYFGGFLAFNAGMTLWISGGVKRSNNRKAAEELLEKQRYGPQKLSLGVTNNGVGLIVKL